MSKWTCKCCTFENESDSICCQVCENVKFEEPENLEKSCRYRTKPMSSYTYKKDSKHTDFEASNEIRIVLIGRTGSGKSVTGNSLLDKEQFESMVSASSVTSKCKWGESTQNGKKIIVVDTPGLFDTGMTHEKVTKEIVKCIGMTSPGLHAMVLVVGIGRFTKEEQDTVSNFVDLFGDGIFRYMVVLFTRKDDLTQQKQSICDYVKHVPKELASILQQCGNRFIAFNNYEKGQNKNDQVAEFYDKVDRMLVNNGGSCYTSEIYQEAELTLQRRMRAEREKLEKQQRMDTEQIQRKHAHRLQKYVNEKTRIEEELKSMKRQEVKDKEERQILEKKVEGLKRKLYGAENSGVRYDAEDRRRMEKKIESLQQQLKSVEIRSADREREQLQRELDESNRRLQKESEAKDREMERELKRKDDEYKSRMETDKLRQKERDNVENGDDGALSDFIEGFKKLGSGALKVGTMIRKLFGF